MTATAYPLAWPFGWPRTPGGNRSAPRFRTSVKVRNGDATFRTSDEIRLPEARKRLADELERLGAREIVLSTNLELRADGQPRGDRAAPADPGAAVYFKVKKRDFVLACDRWNSVAGNLAALAAHVNAMRGMDRWGVGTVEQMFTGYSALPAPLVVGDWRTPLGNPETLDQANDNYRRLIKECGNSGARAYELNAAIEAARKAFSNGNK